MSFIEFCRNVHLLHFSKPVENRPIYQAVVSRKPTRIVEFGLNDGRRTVQILQIARRLSPKGGLQYTGVDLFEARPKQQKTGLRLKDAHQMLKLPDVKVQLVPGDPFSALARMANALPDIDLILIAKDQDPESLQRAWFYVPRMLHERSLILQEKSDGTGFLEKTLKDFADPALARRAA